MSVRRSAAVLAALLIPAGALTATSASAATLGPVEVRFEVADVDANGFTTWTVPANICAIDIEAAGGDGGDSWVAAAYPDTTAPGRGAVITTRTAVTPGTALTVAVGSSPGESPSGGVPGGGPADGGPAGGGGGGWSGVAAGVAPDQSNVLVVAAGGGGAGNDIGAYGGDADAGSPGVGAAGGATPGTDVAGGTGGVGALNGGDGAALQGGYGANGGGGGGAGWFGGGGGAVYAANSGGAGGSSFPHATSSDRLSYRIKSGTDTADGWVVIRYDSSDPADTCTTPTASAVDGQGNPLAGQTLKAGDGFTVTGSDWPVGELIEVTFESTPIPLGTITVGPAGTFTFIGTVPVQAAGGAHSVVLTPAAATLPDFRFGLTVAALAVSGSDASGALWLSVALLATGLALLMIAVRRTRRRSA